jgi:hypothetical protein
LTARRSAFAARVVLAAALSAAGTALAQSSGSDEIYRLGRDALQRGAFEAAARLFTLLEEEPRFVTDPRFAYNRAQASRYAGAAGEAVAWFSRYLSLDPNASDARTVRELVAKLSASAPKALRQEAVRTLEKGYARLRSDPELARTLEDCPRVRLSVRFRKVTREGKPEGEGGTSYLYPGRAVFWDLAGSEPRLWVVATAPIPVPEDLGAPLQMALPAGRPFAVALGTDLKCAPVLLRVPPVPYLPGEAEIAGYRAEVSVELDRTGPPVFLTGAAGGAPMSEVESGPFDGAVVLGKRQRELPVTATQLAFGPRPAAPDARAYAGQALFVVDLPAKDGQVQRWAAPVAAFTVVNAFGSLAEAQGGPRLYVRADAQGSYLTSLR